MIKLDISNSSIDQKMINKYADKVAKIHEQLHEKADDEKEFLGWIKLPTNYDKAEFERIKKAARKIQRDSVMECQRKREKHLKSYMLETT